jgi:hypothetical protein
MLVRCPDDRIQAIRTLGASRWPIAMFLPQAVHEDRPVASIRCRTVPRSDDVYAK